MSDDICNDFTPYNDEPDNKRYYIKDLRERQREYLEMINDYDDGRCNI